MVNSAGYHQGDSAFYVGETPCDSQTWTNHGIAPPPKPCQRNPKWTLLKNDKQLRKRPRLLRHQLQVREDRRIGVLQQRRRDRPEHARQRGRSSPTAGTSSNAMTCSGTTTTTSSPARPSTPSPAGSASWPGRRSTTRPGSGSSSTAATNNVVRKNNVFGNYKWGVASFSGPGEIFVANEGDDAKNINNQIVENTMGREGADPNGEFDFWNDDTGGGNCWSGNTAAATFAPGNGKVSLSQDLPRLPAAGSPQRPGPQPQHRRRAAAEPRRRKRPEDDPRLRRLDAAAEPAVHAGSAGSPPTRRSRSSSRSRSRRRPGEVTCK